MMTAIHRVGSARRATAIITVAAALTATGAQAEAAPASQDPVQRGAYLARAGDCTGCHTLAPEGQPFAGGMRFVIPGAEVYSTNITPDPETGIGHYTTDAFVKAMHEGVTEDGERLYPAMPYPSYAKVSKEDLVALYAYFMQGVKPVHNPNIPAKTSWLTGGRSFLAIWNALYLKKGEYVDDPTKSVPWNRGAYLVQGLEHCGACHTPRGLAGQEKGGKSYLAGATIENWRALPLTGDVGSGLYAWSKDDIVEFLGTGRSERIEAVGMMAGVVGNSTQYLTDPDLLAIAEYLKSLPPTHRAKKGHADEAGPASSPAVATGDLRAGKTAMRGSGLYLDNCSKCHQADGSGTKRMFPNLVKNEAVNAEEPISLIHIVLDGSSMPATQKAPSVVAMPSLGSRLSDEDVADVITFVRSSWGNHASAVKRSEVSRVRKTLALEKTTPKKSS